VVWDICEPPRHVVYQGARSALDRAA
jgi:hypothetical protein